MGLTVGVDVGGTKIAAGVVDEQGKIIDQTRVETPEDDEARHALAMAFNGLVYFLYENNWVGGGLAFPEDIDGRTAALEFLTGYVLEKSLSLDNIFVIALIFTHFRIPLAYQHRVLFWGLVGALAMRGVIREELRLPLVRLGDANRARLQLAMKEFGLL
mgnify:CR=1 FL=1